MSDPIDHRAGAPDALKKGALARALPDPPPPRPARREATIAAALARFDGMEGPAPSPRPASTSPVWWRTNRVQFGAIASVALVAFIAVPLALQHPDAPVDRPRPTVLADTADTAPQVRKVAPAEPATALPSAERAPPGRVSPAERLRSQPTPPAPAPQAVPALTGSPATLAAAPAPLPPAAPAPARLASAPVLTEARAKVAGEAGPARPALNGASDVVVTGSRVTRRAAATSPRGDWNACTVDDPDQMLRGCGGLARHRTEGAPATAADELAKALALARSQDWAGALAALDRAVALQPRRGIAYLNRGLVHQHLGDTDAAAADLDLAVRFDPSARSFFARSRLRRERGEARAARADERRAIELDPDYASVVPE